MIPVEFARSHLASFLERRGIKNNSILAKEVIGWVLLKSETDRQWLLESGWENVVQQFEIERGQS